MMSTITLAGDYRSALTHFALYGLAILAETHHPGAVTLGWSDEAIPKAQLDIEGVGLDTMAEYILQYSVQLSSADSWVAVNNEYESGKNKATFSPFSPRILNIDPEVGPDDWTRHQKVRHDAIDQLTSDDDLLSLRWIAGLGEAAYWQPNDKRGGQDYGASRWEMKARQQGQEFVQHRLRPLCKEISAWTVSDISEGITGLVIRDTIAKKLADSRTSTGFTPPGPTDVVLAFCALLGISCFPVIHKVDDVSVTPGAWPANQFHPNKIALPVMVQRITPARLRSILRSRAFSLAVERVCISGNDAQKYARSNIFTSISSFKWLKSWGVGALITFPIFKKEGARSVERQVQYGTAVPL